MLETAALAVGASFDDGKLLKSMLSSRFPPVISTFNWSGIAEANVGKRGKIALATSSPSMDPLGF